MFLPRALRILEKCISLESIRSIEPCILLPIGSVRGGCLTTPVKEVSSNADNDRPTFRVWLEHKSMVYFSGRMKPQQSGVNGVRYAAESHYLTNTATAKTLLMRVKVDPQTLDAAGSPELVVAGRMADDFLIDEQAEVLYVTTHRQNTIDVVSMDPGLNSGFTQTVAGDPFTEQLIGPSA